MKFLLSPAGLILIVIALVILFWPRRTPDVIKKRVGKPMRAFPDESDAPKPAETRADGAGSPRSSETQGESGARPKPPA